eukprot:tig00020875_g14898.t1
MTAAAPVPPLLPLRVAKSHERVVEHFPVLPVHGSSKVENINACRGMIGRLPDECGVSLVAYGPKDVSPWSTPLVGRREAADLLTTLEKAPPKGGAADIKRGLLEAIRVGERSPRPATESCKIITLFVDGSATADALSAAAEAANAARNAGYMVRVVDVDGSSGDVLDDDAPLAAVADPGGLFVGPEAVKALYDAASRPSAASPAGEHVPRPAPAPPRARAEAPAGAGAVAGSGTILSAGMPLYPVYIGEPFSVLLEIKLPEAAGGLYRVQAVENGYTCGGCESSADVTVEAGQTVLKADVRMSPKFGPADLDAGVRSLSPTATFELLALRPGQPAARVPLSRNTVVFPLEAFTGDVYSEHFRPADGRKRHTILFHGNMGSGKSATTNSLYSCLFPRPVRNAATGGSLTHVTTTYRRYAMDPPYAIGAGLPFAIAEMPGKDDYNYAGEELAMACGGLLADGDQIPAGREAPLTLREKLLKGRDSAEVELERAAPVVVFVFSAEEARGAESADGGVARLQPQIADVVRGGRRVAVIVTHGDDIPDAAERSKIVDKLVRALAVDRNSIHVLANNIAKRDKDFEKDKAAYLALLAVLEDACTVPSVVLTRPYGQHAAPAPNPAPAPAPAPAAPAAAALTREDLAADAGTRGEAGEAPGAGAGGEAAAEGEELGSDVEWSGDEAELDVEEEEGLFEGLSQAGGGAGPGAAREHLSAQAGPLARLVSAGRAWLWR